MDLSKFDDLQHWRIACDCSDPNCDYDVWVDYNDILPEIHFGHDLRTYDRADKYWDGWKYYPKLIWWRIKTAARVLFVGKVETYSEFVLNLQNTQAFIEIMQAVQEHYKGTHWEKQWQASSNTNTSSSEQK